MSWQSVVYNPPMIRVTERKPWWKFWRRARWHEIPNPYAGAGLFIAVDTDGQRVSTSPDGVTWTARRGNE